MRLTTRTTRRSALILGLALLGGCAATPDAAWEAPVIAFPPAPDEPRFFFETTLVSSAQMAKADPNAEWKALLTGQAGASGQGFAKPFGVAACKGTIYVSDSVTRQVMAFDAVGRRFFEIGLEYPGKLAKPLGIATDRECNLYVADSTNRQILSYDRNGKFLKGIGESADFQRLSYVATNPEGTRLYAVDTGGVTRQEEHRVRVYDTDTGDHLFDFGTRGTGPGEFNLPRDITVAPDGTVYVVDGGNFRVQAFSPDGQHIRTFGSIGRQYGQFSRPKGIAADADGNVYVADTAFGNFQIFDAEGNLLLFIGNRGEQGGPAEYMLPSGLAVDEDGRVYFVDQYHRKVDIYRPARLAQEEGHLGAWFRAAE